MKFQEWIKIQEMGTGPYIGGCGKHADFQVFGACSDQKMRKKKRKKINEVNWKDFKSYGMAAAAVGATIGLSQYNRANSDLEQRRVPNSQIEANSPFYDWIEYKGKEGDYLVMNCQALRADVATEMAKWYYVKHFGKTTGKPWGSYDFQVNCEPAGPEQFMVKIKANNPDSD